MNDTIPTLQQPWVYVASLVVLGARLPPSARAANAGINFRIDFILHYFVYYFLYLIIIIFYIFEYIFEYIFSESNRHSECVNSGLKKCVSCNTPLGFHKKPVGQNLRDSLKCFFFAMQKQKSYKNSQFVV